MRGFAAKSLHLAAETGGPARSAGRAMSPRRVVRVEDETLPLRDRRAIQERTHDGLRKASGTIGMRNRNNIAHCTLRWSAHVMPVPPLRMGCEMNAHRPVACVAGWCVGLTVKVAPWFTPRLLCVTRDVVVIRHPRPVSLGHLLILPRNRVPGLDGSLEKTSLAVSAMLPLMGPLANGHFDHPEHVIAVINGGARQTYVCCTCTC